MNNFIGGQGTGTVNDGFFIKKFYKKDNLQKKRITDVVNLKLYKSSELFANAPISILPDRSGHKSKFSKGKSLKNILETENDLLDVQDFIYCAIQICIGVKIMNTLGLSHGDLSYENIFIEESDDIFKVRFIDFDSIIYHDLTLNLNLIPPVNFADPELLSNENRYPDTNSDHFSLAVLLHLILTKEHPFERNHDIDSIFSGQTKSYNWSQDPFDIDNSPAAIFSPGLNDLFRRAFDSSMILTRPTAEEWLTELQRLSNAMMICDSCNSLFFNHEQIKHCPVCKIEPKIKARFESSFLTISYEHEDLISKLNKYGFVTLNLNNDSITLKKHGFLYSVTAQTDKDKFYLKDGSWINFAETECISGDYIFCFVSSKQEPVYFYFSIV